MLECLSELHCWQPPGNFKTALCAALLKVVPGSHISYCVVDPVRQTTRAVGTTRIAPHDEARRFLAQLNQYVRVHPCIDHWLKHPRETLTSISDVAPAREYRRTSLYNDVYRPQDIEDQLALNLSESASEPWHIVTTSRHQRGFGAPARERLAILRPHLIAAVRRARVQARLRVSAARTRRQLELLAPAAISLAADEKGRAVFCNPRARALLATWFPFVPLQKGDPLPEALAAWLREQRRPAGGSLLSLPRQPLVQAGPDGRRLVVNLFDAADGRGDLLVLEEHGSGAASSAPLRALGLSERQAEVLLWIAEGKSNADIGTILGISLPTVKMHVMHLFEKLGCKTRPAAARLALEALPPAKR